MRWPLVPLGPVRAVVVPGALTCAVATGFGRAFEARDLVVATAASVVLGGVTGLVAPGREPERGWWTMPAAVVVAAACAWAGVYLVTGSIRPLDAVGAGVGRFLTVGLPSPGLPSLRVVVFCVAFSAMAATTRAHAAGRTLGTVAVPVVATAVTGVLVAPVGVPWWSPALLATGLSWVLVESSRDGGAALPVLEGVPAGVRREPGRWRALAHAVPILLVVAAVGAAVPVRGGFDVRAHIRPATVRMEDPNPLAVAARWRRLEDPAAVAAVDVRGPSPGRLRVAVLDTYTDTGWSQAAEYRITGDTFVADPVYPEGPATAGSASSGRTTTVAVRRLPGDAFRAVPTGGVPLATTDPRDLRFSPEAGVVLTRDPGRTVTYRSVPTAGPDAGAGDDLVGRHPSHLAACPRSPTVRSVSDQLTSTAPNAVGRLAAIENWLLTRRIYDPGAPGGQTLGSVDALLSQPFARGNLEVFVTAYALLARCAGVPARVVVGYPTPPQGRSTVVRRDVVAWVEVPLTDSGWVPRDPLPTPEEQELQARLVDRRPPPQPEPPTSPTPRLREVAAAPASDPSGGPSLVGPALLALTLAGGWGLLGPRALALRRRHTADPGAAVVAAWDETVEHLVDRGVPVGAAHTPAEMLRLAAVQLPAGVEPLLVGIAHLVDRVRYSGRAVEPAEVATAWGHADAIRRRLGPSAATRWVALAHPVRVLRRLRRVMASPARRRRWEARLPEVAATPAELQADEVPGVAIQERLSEGRRCTVWRGVLLADRRPVAVEVFATGPGSPAVDAGRIDREARIAHELSAVPHLPTVHAAGISTSGRPFVVTDLHDRGTVASRVAAGGPMSEAEVLEMGGDLATALDALHRAGIVHGGVRPEKVFASPTGWVLGEVGCGWSRGRTAADGPGSPAAAMPLEWRGGSPDVGADIHAMALTMLFARTGRVPRRDGLPDAAEVEAAFPSTAVVVRALDPDPRRRPRAVSELGRELRPGWFSPVTGGALVTLDLPRTTDGG